MIFLKKNNFWIWTVHFKNFVSDHMSDQIYIVSDILTDR